MWILRGSDDAGPPSSARPVRGPGTIRDWATGRGHDLAGTHLYDGESLPNLDTFDWLVVMGGPMSVHDTDEYSWLAVEKDLIRAAVDDDKIVATRNAFHGRTLGALAATWKQKYREPFEPLAGGVEFVDYGGVTAMADVIDDDTAAVIVEPIQGEGGINPGGRKFLQTVRVHTAQHGAAMIADEIQTGLGRTGRMWASERYDVVPDVLTTAKGLASGLPMGATLCRDWVADGAGNHGSTFSGGPVVSAAAVATLRTIIDDDFSAHAADLGGYLVEELQETLGDTVRDVRGEGPDYRR